MISKFKSISYNKTSEFFITIISSSSVCLLFVWPKSLTYQHILPVHYQIYYLVTFSLNFMTKHIYFGNYSYICSDLERTFEFVIIMLCHISVSPI
jgi:hypothetical protein